ncbi:MAG: CxxxxCH/CxxCH domain-containing protein, partial [Deltaproteobacteria bacterium]|nr:CxxxxCH/CxxCH domain-containing protein [Deltaproteobacteria bacterium]
VHTTVAEGNASVCAFCHTGGANSPVSPPSPPAPAGTPPGCFNSTLCHGAAAAPHAIGSAWIIPGASFHGLTAKADLAFCQTCHGTPGTILFDGGVAPTACSTCHPAADSHPTTWSPAPQTGFPPYTPSHRDAGDIATSCAICHVVDGPGTGLNPAAPSCFSASFTNANNVAASCHASGPGAANHLVPFLDPVHMGVDQVEFDGDCTFCHAVSGTSPIASAPACQVCHTAGSPLAPPPGSFGVCTSCHGFPPDGGLGTYPNVAGAHLVHLDLDLLGMGSPVDCDTCHLGLGFVTQAHYDRANGRPGAGGRVPPGDLAFDNVYNAQTGASSFDNTLSLLNCSNVSCHGGQTTPNWQTEMIDVDSAAGCLECHAFGTAQYNSYSSGQHDVGAHVSSGCTACHNTTALAVNHFTALSTTAMEGPASATVGGGTTSVSSYIAPTCIAVCHPSGETW